MLTRRISAGDRKWVRRMIVLYPYTSFPATMHTPGSILRKEYHKSCTEPMMHVLQIVTYAVVEKGMEHKEEQR